MDIILDTCILLSNPSMRSPDFLNLFAYLQRMNTYLIVLDIVFDEAIQKYADLLTSRRQRAHNAVEQLNFTLVTPSAASVPELQIPNERARYAELLSSGFRPGDPSSPRIKKLQCYSGIDPREVALRGIRRIPPADSNGEQLRDVMVWLAARSYCKSIDHPTVFISSDDTFLTKDKSAFKPELINELGRDAIPLRPFPSIEAFLKSVAITVTANVEPQWIASHLSVPDIQQAFNRSLSMLVYDRFTGGRSVEALEPKFEFHHATIYDLGDGAALAEVKVHVSTVLRVSDWPYPPPEATLSGRELELALMHQKPVWSEDCTLQGMFVLSLRLQNDRTLSISPVRFEHESQATLICDSPVIFYFGGQYF
jgi:hypothetical protein